MRSFFITIISCFFCFTCIKAQEIENEGLKSENDPSTSPLKAQYASNALSAEDSTRVFTIRKIYFSGNKKTKPFIINRELPFREGQSMKLNELVKQFKLGENQLMNSALFVTVHLSFKEFESDKVDVLVEVKERWYIFPIPYFKLVDRNFNQWWGEQNRSLERVNYGLKVGVNNVTGRNDKLRIWLINGYTRQYAIKYEQPFADKSLRHGYFVEASTRSNKEVNFRTENDQQTFFKGEEFARKRTRLELGYTYRNGLFARHRLGFAWVNEKISDTTNMLNPNFFGNSDPEKKFPEIRYTFDYSKVDYIPYPLTGFRANASLMKRGFEKSFNLWELRLNALKGVRVGHETYFNFEFNGALKLPFDQPFYNRELFGYGILFLRGTETYVIDGTFGALMKTTLKKELFRFNLPTVFKSEGHKNIPFKVYGKVFSDVGYSYLRNAEPQNQLNNKLLYSGGFGIDIITIYDMVFKIDFSFNQLGQNGLFLHSKDNF